MKANELAQLDMFTSPVECIDYRGYEQRILYDAAASQWQCLSCAPSVFPPNNDSHYWHYGADRDELLASAKQEVDLWLAAGGAADRADWDARYKRGDFTFQSVADARWGT